MATKTELIQEIVSEKIEELKSQIMAAVQDMGNPQNARIIKQAVTKLQILEGPDEAPKEIKSKISKDEKPKSEKQTGTN
jgi:hypothetical protein